MDFQPADVDNLDPSQILQVFCPYCEAEGKRHIFTISVGTLQAVRGMKIQCPDCRCSVGVYINPEGVFCIETVGYVQ
jgi:hypothetical protein